MKQDHIIEDQLSLPLFTAEFAKRQYISLYRVTEAQGDRPTFIYPEILLYIKETMERLRLNDDHSIIAFVQGLSLCSDHVRLTQNQGSPADQNNKSIFRANLDLVIKAVIGFLMERNVALDKTKSAKTDQQQGVRLPTFTEEMRNQLSWEAYLKSDLPAAVRKLS